MEHLPLIDRAKAFGDAPALVTPAGSHTYRELLERSAAVGARLLDGADDLREARVAFLAPPGVDYVAAQWGAWRAGGIAVPLSLAATDKERQYVLQDAGVSRVLVSAELAPKVADLCSSLGIAMQTMNGPTPHADAKLPHVDVARRAMILYTSGTTSQPKGVVTTHDCIRAQVQSLVEAWRWQGEDRIPLFLPLHHIHGIINILACALWSGAAVEPFDRFDLPAILQRVRARAYSLFMAVPTIYVKLIQTLESIPDTERRPIIEGFAAMRLMVSGSAALPASVHEHWTRLTGQKLLERYGMTEIGMALSNPYEGERRPGAVGQPLPGVEVRLQGDTGQVVTAEEEPGEILVRGPNVFLEYWNRAQATAESFQDGWFRTGDIAVLERGYYRILGRSSVDIIKSGGYKLSALEIEAALLDHPAITQCAVVGVPNETWGEIVAVAVVLADGHDLTIRELRAWCQQRISPYKIPRHLLVVKELPRNAMGKVTKPAVTELFTSSA